MPKTSRPQEPRRKTSRVPNGLRPNPRELADDAIARLSQRNEQRLLAGLSEQRRQAYQTKDEQQRLMIVDRIYPIRKDDVLKEVVAFWLESQPIMVGIQFKRLSPDQITQQGARLVGSSISDALQDYADAVNFPIDEYMAQPKTQKLIPALYVDEGLSSAAADKKLREQKKKELIDEALFGLYEPTTKFPMKRVVDWVGNFTEDSLERFLFASPERQVQWQDSTISEPTVMLTPQEKELAQIGYLHELALFEAQFPDQPEALKPFTSPEAEFEQVGPTGERVQIEYGPRVDWLTYQKSKLEKIREPLESVVPQKVQKKIAHADRLESVIAEEKTRFNVAKGLLDEFANSPQHSPEEIEEFRNFQGDILEEHADRIAQAERTLETLRAEIERETFANMRQYSKTDVYEAISAFREPPGHPEGAPTALRMEDPETGESVLAGYSRYKREALINRYVRGEETLQDLEVLKKTKLRIMDFFDDNETLQEYLENLGSVLRGASDPERLKEQEQVLDLMVESGTMSEAQAQNAKDALKPVRKKAAEEFAKLERFAKTRRELMGKKFTGPINNREIAEAFVNRPRWQRAAAAEFTKSARALKHRIHYKDRAGNDRFYDEPVRDANGNIVWAGFTTKSATAPLYSGSIAKQRMRVRNTAVADRVWQRLKAVENEYMRAVELGAADVADDPTRFRSARELFAVLVRDYENYSKQERDVPFRIALADPNVDKERNAPRDLLRIRDLIAEFGFRLPQWSSARVKMTMEPLQEGGITYEELAASKRTDVEPARINADQWFQIYGVARPKKLSPEEKARRGREQKAQDFGAKLRKRADPKFLEREINMINAQAADKGAKRGTGGRGQRIKSQYTRTEANKLIAQAQEDQVTAAALLEELQMDVVRWRQENNKPLTDDDGNPLPISDLAIGIAKQVRDHKVYQATKEERASDDDGEG